MKAQEQMFPVTEEERIATLRSNLASDLSKKEGKRDAAASALMDANETLEEARGLLAVFDHLVAERASRRAGLTPDEVAESIAQEAAEIVNSGALDGDGVTVTAEAATETDPYESVVIALYPDDEEPHVTKIGAHTRYSELVADYLAAAGLDEEIDDYEVWDEQDPKQPRMLKDAIDGADYGKRLRVSLTGHALAERAIDADVSADDAQAEAEG